MAPPVVPRRASRTRRLPARYVVNFVSIMDEGGHREEDPLISVLTTGSELELECEEQDFPSIAQSFI